MKLLLLACIINMSIINGISKSKLSIFSGWGDLSLQFMENAKPKTFKLFDNFNNDANAKKIKQLSNNETLIIGRIYNSNQPTNISPNTAAQNWWNTNKDIILQNPSIDYWEGYNEPACDSNNIQWITNMEIARLNILKANNLKACIFNFAVGTPDVTNATLIKIMYPAIQIAINDGHILGLHEYSSPWMTSWYSNTTNDGWLTGRYRKLYNEYFIPNGLGNIKLVITELGIDSGCPSNTCSSCNGGWMSFESYWCQNGESCNGAWEYSWQLEWYDSLMLQNNYVLGANIFCVEIPGWNTFQLNQNVINYLVSYMNSV